MIPWITAAEWQKEHSAQSFEDRLGVYLSQGFVWATPYCFMLAREVHWDSERKEISIGNEEYNAWFVELAATNEACANPVREFLRVAPWKHPVALWCRRGEMRVREFRWDKLSRKVGLN